MKKSIPLASFTPIALMLLINPAYAQDNGEDKTQADSSELGEIVVTASRRETSLQETPVAVSAFTAEKLQDAQLNSLTDLAALTPNLVISSTFTNANVTMRGIGNTITVGGAEPGVAVHVDGAYVSRPLLMLSTFLDVERVEVLRGPQGTLFGRNATGGAVNIIANKPKENFAGSMDLYGGVDPGTARISGFITGPLSADGSVRARVAAQYSYSDGFVKNGASNGPGRLDDLSAFSTRGQIEWEASSGFLMRLSVDYQRERDNGQAGFLLGVPDSTQVLPLPLIGAPTGSYTSRTTFANYGLRDVEGTSVTANAMIPLGGGELRALVNYGKSSIETIQDGDGTAVDFTSTRFADDGRSIFTELLYTSDAAKAFRFVIGANFFREKLLQNVTVPVMGLPVPIDLGGTVVSKSYAAFASATLDIGDKAKLYGGLRYSNDRKSVDEFNNFIGTGTQAEKWSKVTYEIGGSYELSDAVNAYAKFSTGYKGGGFSIGALTPGFSPETSANIEAGLKGRFFDDKLQTNLAAFHMTYDELQVNQVVGVVSSVTNAAKAQINGIEAELIILPVKDLRLELSGALLDAKFKEFISFDSARPALGMIDLSGNCLPNAPKASFSAGAYYTVPAASGDFTLGARYDWSDTRYFTEFNIPISGQSSAGKLDLSLNWKSSDGLWNAGLHARNILDTSRRSSVIVVSALLGSLAIGQYEPGRQIGLSIGRRF